MPGKTSHHQFFVSCADLIRNLLRSHEAEFRILHDALKIADHELDDVTDRNGRITVSVEIERR